MVRRKVFYVIRRENNVVEVNFRREPDPPAPKFPGASGLRALNEERGESWSLDDEGMCLVGPELPRLPDDFICVMRYEAAASQAGSRGRV
jgi:hypothetical protein